MYIKSHVPRYFSFALDQLWGNSYIISLLVAMFVSKRVLETGLGSYMLFYEVYHPTKNKNYGFEQLNDSSIPQLCKDLIVLLCAAARMVITLSCKSPSCPLLDLNDLNTSVDYLVIWYSVLSYVAEHPGILGSLQLLTISSISDYRPFSSRETSEY